MILSQQMHTLARSAIVSIYWIFVLLRYRLAQLHVGCRLESRW